MDNNPADIFPTFCGLGVQQQGTTPLGTSNLHGLGGTCTGGGDCVPGSNTEYGIATNGDGAQQASFANGQIWFAVSTLVIQSDSSTMHLGAAYFVVNPYGFALTTSGYVTAAGEDMEFPAIAASDGSGSPTTSVLSFTVSGTNMYPSSAYGTLTTTSGGLISSNYHVTAVGQAPQDGFSGYAGGGYRPRWGDYGAAIYVPSAPGSSTGTTFFASEYIQYPACSVSAFTTDPSCGGTRDPFANWGTSLNSIPIAPPV